MTSSPIEDVFADSVATALLGDSSPHEFPRFLLRMCLQFDVRETALQHRNRAYRLEAQLWDLVWELISYRASLKTQPPSPGPALPPVPPPFVSNAPYLDTYLTHDTQMAELWRVDNWLRTNLVDLDANRQALGTQKWAHTRLSMQRSNIPLFTPMTPPKSPVLSSIDPDAPIRENKPLHTEDAAADAAFFRELYYLVLARRDAEALALCQDTGNWTAYMALQGLSEYADPLADGEGDGHVTGIKNRSLWRQRCIALSTQTEGYESAFYEFLGGGVTRGLEANFGKWEESFLVLVEAFLVRKLEERVAELRGTSFVGDAVVKQFSGIGELLGVLNETPGLEAALIHNLRVLMSLVITDSLENTFASFLARDVNKRVLQAGSGEWYTDLDDSITDLSPEVVEEDEEEDYEETESELEQILAQDENYDNFSSYLVRVLAHLAMYVDKVMGSRTTEAYKSALIRLYLRRLFKKGFYRLIPVYIAVLEEPEERVRIYGYYLSKIHGPVNREVQLRALSEFDFGDAQAILENAVQRGIFTWGGGDNLKVMEDEAVGEREQYLYRSIEWLTKGHLLYRKAVYYSVRIFFDLLFRGKIAACVAFYREFKFGEIVKKADMENTIAMVEEGSETEGSESSTTDEGEGAKNEYEVSRAVLMELLHVVKEGFIRIVEFEQFLAERGLDYTKETEYSALRSRRWIGLKTELKERFIDPLRALVEKLGHTDFGEESERFKVLYVPYFVISLHKMLVNTRFCDVVDLLDSVGFIGGSSFMREAVDLCVFVAEEGLGDYFVKAGRMGEYLGLVGECAAEGGSILYK